MSSSENEKYILELDNFKVDQEGNLYNVEPTKNGEGISTEIISNHSPILHRNVRIQDGFTTVEQIEFRALREHKYEAPVLTDKKAIRGATPDVIFSPACFIYPGRGHVSLYSLFMLKQCAKDSKVENLYTHTGWMVTEDGERVFLNGENSVCKDGLTDKYSVQLLPDFKKLQFYEVYDNSHVCLNTVVDEMEKTVPDWVHIPLYAYVFLTPLNDMLRQKGKEPNFSLYIIGKTGTFKSSISKVLLCFFGRYNYADTAPITFFDTENMMEKKLAIGADLPLLADDRRPTNNYRDKITYESKEKALSAYIGDRVGRGRMNADGSSRKTYIPRSNLIVTAEEAYVNIGGSSIARSISVELEPGTIDFTGLQYLQEHPEHFNKVMQLYIQFIIQHYDAIDKASDGLLKQFREIASNRGHARLATTFSQLMFGYFVYLSFLVDYRHISKEQMEERLAAAQDIFLDMCDKQDKRIEEEASTVLFISLLKEMLETKRVQLADLRESQTTGTVSLSTRATCIGYRDDDFIYLIPQDAYNEVFKYYGESGNVFHASRTTLWKMLMDEGKIAPKLDKQGNFVRVDKPKQINGKSGRYIWLLASALDNDDSEEGEKDE